MQNNRVLKLNSADNVRELGGYKTADGRQIKWNKLLRCGALSFIKQPDLQVLEDYGVKYDVDLRSGQEKRQHQDQIEESNIKYIFDPVFNEDRTDNSQDPEEFHKIVETDPDYALNHMTNVYRQMITKPACRKAFHELFEILLANRSDKESVLFHCTAGKDRTGLAAVFVLSALGVDSETIKADYLMTNEVVKDVTEKKVAYVKKNGFSERAAENMRTLYSVRSEFLEAALAEIDHHYGNMDNFLKTGIGLTDENLSDLKAIYLE